MSQRSRSATGGRCIYPTALKWQNDHLGGSLPSPMVVATHGESISRSCVRTVSDDHECAGQRRASGFVNRYGGGR